MRASGPVIQFTFANTDRLFSSDLVNRLNNYPNRPWKDRLRGKAIDDRWLARQLHPYGICPRNMRIDGVQAKGYFQDDMVEVVRRYVPKAEARALLDELKPIKDDAPAPAPTNAQAPDANAPNGQVSNGQTPDAQLPPNTQ